MPEIHRKTIHSFSSEDPVSTSAFGHHDHLLIHSISGFSREEFARNESHQKVEMLKARREELLCGAEAGSAAAHLEHRHR
jgi:hypothetical protein